MAKSIHELIAESLGVDNIRVGDNPLNEDVDIASKVILKSDPMRYAFLLVNVSANDIYLVPRRAVVGTAGILLGANGGFFALNWRDDLVLPAVEWHAAAAGNNSAIEIYTVEGEPSGRVI
jgi:hypothetical protein